MSNIERREHASPIELRESPAESPSPGVMVGYAAVFNRASVDLGGFIEVIAPGAFTRTLRTADVICNRNHDDDKMLGRTSSGTCSISEDTIGLRVECQLADTTTGRDTAVDLGRGDFSGMSFAFIAVAERWDFGGDLAVRTLIDCDLYDVSVVGRPAYDDTSVGLRAADLEVARRNLDAERTKRAAASLPAAIAGAAAEGSPLSVAAAPTAASTAPTSPPAARASADLSLYAERLRLLALASV